MTENLLKSGDGEDSSRAEASLLALLDREIENARQDRSRYGWSRWGLLLAIGGLLWAAVREHQASTYAVPVALAWFVAGSLVLDLLVDGLVQRWDFGGDRKRLRVGSFAGRRTLGLVAIGVRATLIVAAAWIASEQLSLAAMVATMSLYAFMLLSMAIVTFAVMREDPLQAGLAPASPILTRGLQIISAVALVATIRSSPFPAGGTAVTPVLVGVLIAVALYLWVVLMGEHHRDPVLETLIDIRRDLILREVDHSASLNRTLVALRGMSFADWTRSDILELQSLYQRVVGFERAIEEMAELTVQDLDLLGAGKMEDVPKSLLAIRGRLDSMSSAAHDMNECYERISQISVDIAGKVGYVRSMDESLAEEARQTDEAVRPLAEDAMRRAVRIEVQLPAFAKQIRSALEPHE